MLAVLRARALRTITQGHLAQHLLFHSLHQFAIPSEAPDIFGVTDAEFRALRRGEQSPLDIGRVHGRSPAEIQALAAAVLRERVRAGIRTGATTHSRAGCCSRGSSPSCRAGSSRSATTGRRRPTRASS